MNAQLFVRMPTKFCDYTQVFMPPEMKNFNLCNGCIMRAYQRERKSFHIFYAIAKRKYSQGHG